MTSDNQQSLGDENTFQGEHVADEDLKSLGDRSTFIGANDSSLAGMDGLADDEQWSYDETDTNLDTRFEFIETLGEGGMGQVQLALDTRMNRKVAIKRIKGHASRSKKIATRFMTEAKAMAAITHPNIVVIYEYGTESNGPFLVMEYVEGGTLLDKCKLGPVEAQEAIELICQLCGGLAKAHSAGIIHRDIKPANVLLTEDGVPKLADFGLAKGDALDSGMTVDGAVLGTLDFMPPEQRRNAALVDARSDIWSLAATLYQMLTGQSPRQIKYKLLPNSLHEVMEKALEEDKELRYQSSLEFRDALKLSQQKASQPVGQFVDVNAGECPKCHSQNDASRKFCVGCGGSLRLKCLGCSEPIPVWEKFCGECGGNQPELYEAIRNELEESRSSAEKHHLNYRFDEAMRTAEAISSRDDPRFSDFVEWAAQFLEDTKSEFQKARQSAQEKYQEGQKHRKLFDYKATIAALESIPEPMRSREVSQFLAQAVAEQREAVMLLREIPTRVKKREIDGLSDLVDRAITLLGERKDLLRLREQLIERARKKQSTYQKLYESSQKLFGEGKAQQALKTLQKIPTKELSYDQQKLLGELDDIVTSEKKLSRVLKTKLTSDISPHDAEELLELVKDYLERNPNHSEALCIQQQLLQKVATYDSDPESLELQAWESYFGDGAPQDYDRAANFFLTAARQGVNLGAGSQAIIGELYQLGLGVTQDYKQAVHWYRLAADQGDSLGQWRLGAMYQDGIGIAQDYEQAVHWYRLAAEQGDSGGQSRLGQMYDFGIGIAQDAEQAVHWYRLAADQGDSLGQWRLGAMYQDGIGIAQDYEQAVHWYRLAAEQGDSGGQSRLGQMYQFGFGIAQDDEQAVHWYRLAADQGDSLGQWRLGAMYQDGAGIAQDYEQAVHWYRLAAEQGDSGGQSRLGHMYQAGLGIAQDDEQAVHWYRLAAEQGDVIGQYFLGHCYRHGFGVSQDSALAFHWLQMAAEQGQPDSAFDIGEMFEFGEGTEPNQMEAMNWYRVAAERGHEEAKAKIDK